MVVLHLGSSRKPGGGRGRGAASTGESAGLLCPAKLRFWAGRKALVLLSPGREEKGDLVPPSLQSRRWFTDAEEEVGDAGTEDSAQQLRLGMLALQLSIRRN